MNKPAEGNTSYVTGGDVSRFQRRTIASVKTPAAYTPPPQNYAPRFQRASDSQSSGPVVKVTRGKVSSDVQVGGQ